MRTIGNLDSEAKARTFSDFLYAQGIENQIEADKDGSWAVWIHSEEEMDRAKKMMADYLANPGEQKYKDAGVAAAGLRSQKQREQEDYEKRTVRRQQLFRPMTAYGFGPLTFLLILASIAVFIRSHSSLRFDPRPIYGLYISETDASAAYNPGVTEWDAIRIRLNKDNRKQVIPEVLRGQIWRLLTPIFIHFDFLHIFFDLLWLWDLGSMIEGRQNSVVLLLLVVVIGVVSNIAQDVMHGPNFGGMSGVVFGLLGYIWIRGKLDPGSGLYLHPATVTMMIIWFFACLIGFEGGNIANTAHGAGFFLGIVWGALSAMPYRLKWRR